jgi:hypothetical protein
MSSKNQFVPKTPTKESICPSDNTVPINQKFLFSYSFIYINKEVEYIFIEQKKTTSSHNIVPQEKRNSLSS